MRDNNLFFTPFQWIYVNTKGPCIDKTKNIIHDLKGCIEKNRTAFSNYNIVRMREAIRYFSKEQLQIFIKIPFLLHINSPKYPGFIDSKMTVHGIWNFENSGFYKEAIKSNFFSKAIIDKIKNVNPAILGFYHIGSLGTFTQSIGSDFDYWVIIDKKKFTKDRYNNLEAKLDAILKYSREEYNQEVSFFIIDKKDIKNDCYAPFMGEETLLAPKKFLKEEFYRTFLMIAGKIPVWFVLPDKEDLQQNIELNSEGIKTQVLSIHDDLIDLGQIRTIPVEDVLKGLLWHICKSKEDSVKAIIKATMIFSYGFSSKMVKLLLCEKIKAGYSMAGIDDYSVDPYKVLFDQIIEFHETENPEGLNLIKNAIFFRLCEYPNVKMPAQNTPKGQLLNKYIRLWKLNKNQITKLLSYTSWSESEKLILEKSFISRLAQMFNSVIKKTGKTKSVFTSDNEKRNWAILTNKIRERLRKNPNKIPECSIYLRRRHLIRFDILENSQIWVLNMVAESGKEFSKTYKHSDFLGVLGWILGNQIYNRQKATIHLRSRFRLFKSVEKPVDLDKLYMAFQPLKPLSDNCYENGASWFKMIILLRYEKQVIVKAEFLISNTWGELFNDSINLSDTETKNDQVSLIVKVILKYSNKHLRFFVYQLSHLHDPKIVYQLKKAYNDQISSDKEEVNNKKKPYLDKL
ncbi:MAG: adenylate cyclase [Desulfobacteraceae bacterium]|nr:adenylate cyclase [Desulfobacteraceae bacterium]